MPTDKEILDDFLLEELKLVENNIINTDLKDRDLQYLNLLVYQIEELITRNSSNKEALIKKLDDIELMRNELKKKQEQVISEWLLWLNKDKQIIWMKVESNKGDILKDKKEIERFISDIKKFYFSKWSKIFILLDLLHNL